ncbi:MAG TPA: AAA family ATPase [Candidatus Limnocylindria bacterium]|nr:AAA family ATPase [Candidatus Limnocylindria bacterium]
MSDGERTLPAAAVAPTGTLTFLFADLRDYTAFVERHGDAAATELIADYRQVVRAELAKTGGGEIKTEGDSFYLVFPSARLAVQCGVGILRTAERAAATRPERPLRVGIGIHAGEPVAHEGQYVGSAVNIAARLAGAAAAGELLVSDVVRSLLRTAGGPPMEERPGVVLKGVADPPRVFVAEWRPPKVEPDAQPLAPPIATRAAAPPALLCPELIGRETELVRLDQYLRDAIAGHGHTVLVAGEAGFGKSAFLRAFLKTARRPEVLVVGGECSEIEGRRPFGPFVEVMRAAFRELESANFAERIRTHASELLAIFPEGSRSERPDEPIAEGERYRIHSVFAAFFADLSTVKPVVIAIDDLHWADEASLELLPYLARKLRDSRVLLIGTYRSDDLHRLHPFRLVLAELARGRLAEDLVLHKLSREETSRFMRATLRLNRDPSPEFLSALHDRCDGNPFFMEEVLRALAERGDMAFREGSWLRTKDVDEIVIPESVRAAVQERLRVLDEDGQRVLQVAAVVGQRFDFELLRTVSGATEPDLLRYLRRAIEAQLVVAESAGDREERYRFRHALTRETVLADLLQRERRALHLRVGEAIEAATATEPAAWVEELAYHFDEAGDRVRAFRYRDLAAREATRAYGFSRAQRHLERAIELAPQEGAELARLHVRLADAADDPARAWRAAAEGRRLADAAGASAVAVQCLTRMAHVRFLLGDWPKAYELALEAVRVAEPLGATPELAEACGQAARYAMLELGFEEASGWADRALAAARETGNVRAEADVLNTLGGMRALQGAVDEGVGLLRDSLRIGLETRDRYLVNRGYINLMTINATCVSPEATRHVLAEALEWEAQVSARTQAFVLFEAIFAFADGDWDTVERLARETTGVNVWSAQVQLLLALVVTARDGPDRALALIDEARPSLQTAAFAGRLALSHLEAELAVLAGDLPAVLKAYETAPPQVLWAFRTAGLMACALWAAGRLGDDAARERIIGRLDPSVLVSASGEPWVMLVEAERAVEDGELARAATRFAESAALFEKWGLPLEATLARLRAADQLYGLGDLAGARNGFEESLAFWKKTGASWYLERLMEWGRERGVAG